MKSINTLILYFTFFSILFASEEFVHDPSRFFLYDDRLIGYSSGSNGIALQGLEIVLKEKLVEHYIPILKMVFQVGLKKYKYGIIQMN